MVKPSRSIMELVKELASSNKRVVAKLRAILKKEDIQRNVSRFEA
jgi:hypothetical protein